MPVRPTPPNWCKNAVMTKRGWIHPRTGELLKVQRFTDEDIDRYRRTVNTVELKQDDVVEEQVEEPEMQMLNEAPANHKSLEDMTKRELQALAEQKGVEITTRDSKKVLIEKLQ